jgi:hypothetical protein
LRNTLMVEVDEVHVALAVGRDPFGEVDLGFASGATVAGEAGLAGAGERVDRPGFSTGAVGNGGEPRGGDHGDQRDRARGRELPHGCLRSR